MKKIISLIKNSFLLFIIFGLFSLPVIVNLNLVPVIDVNLTQGQNITEQAANSSLEERTDILGVSETREVEISYNRLNNIFSGEDLLYESMSSRTSKLSLGKVQTGLSAVKDEIYVITNTSKQVKTISLNFSGDDILNEDIIIHLYINGDRKLVFLYGEFYKINNIVISPESKVRLELEVSTDKKIDLQNSEIRLDLVYF